ncbi:MAG: UDP-N-acetylmuramoyl-L-alanine--D-glutamate ligase [Acetobacteraceae bacterium]|nr:UDP-N-acetylmuramoyl-L-alanine--D-glutamate ligase [Acetobacteraceae bacterium]MSP29382.1 UDP-N-acetylmuramoyl-L-alanine--D-glutamate ligase [Acetobacteraceae bacterium]
MKPFPTNLFAGEAFSVVGLGHNGLPVARALAAMGADITAWDDAEAAREAAAQAGISIVNPAEGARRPRAMILSPGIPHCRPRIHPAAAWARAQGVLIVSDVEILFIAVRRAGSKARFVGITGTNGKSTTTALLAHILAAAGVPSAAGGNLGTAALALPLLPDHGVYVLEMSSYMLERLITVRFDSAALLNLSPDHLDRHGDMHGYAAAKQAIFARQTESDAAIIGIDDSLSRDMAAWRATQPGTTIAISGFQPAKIWGDGAILRDAGGPIIDLAICPTLPGAHNAQNAAAATALAQSLGVERADIARHMPSYPGLAHRQQRIVDRQGVVFINDSKATNVDAAARALGCYDRLIWIAGGMAKEGGIEALQEFFPRIAQAFLIGQDAPALAATLATHGVAHRITGTLDDAVPAAYAAARQAGVGVVLLSPACASFDQFTGFDARGDRFAALAAALEDIG